MLSNWLLMIEPRLQQNFGLLLRTCMIPVAGTLLEPLLRRSRLRYRQRGRRLIAFLPLISSLLLLEPDCSFLLRCLFRVHASAG